MAAIFAKIKWTWVLLGVLGCALVYFLQDFDFTRMRFQLMLYFGGIIPGGEEWRFAVNKLMRFALNDLFAICIIHGFFSNKSYTRFAFYVMLFGLFVLVPLYITLAIIYQQEGNATLQFLHRITMNPVLMVLLIPAFYYQSLTKPEN